MPPQSDVQSPAPGTTDNDRSSSRRMNVARPRSGPRLGRFTGVLLLALFVAVFSAWIPETFLTQATFKAISGDQAITLVLAVGVLFTLATGQYDLSAAQNLGFSAVIDTELMVHQHLAWPTALLITLVLGAVVGALNGLFVAVIGVNSFIATLGMSSVLLALTEQISNNQFIGPVPTSFADLASPTPLGVPIVAWYALGLCLLAWYVLEHSPMGRRLAATGANADAARLAGVRTRHMIIGSFIVTGVISALAGALVAAKIGQVSPSIGPPYLLPAFAACFLGTTQFKLGRFNVWGAVLALYLLATGVKGLQLAGGQLWITDLFNGLALLGAVSVAVASQRRRRHRSPSRTA